MAAARVRKQSQFRRSEWFATKSRSEKEPPRFGMVEGVVCEGYPGQRFEDLRGRAYHVRRDGSFRLEAT